MARLKNVLTVILAGGRGDRLQPLTQERAKPAVPFGGKYRIIDFTLSNCINSSLRKVVVLIQYKSQSLDRHLQLAWNLLNPELHEYIMAVPPQQRISQDWYRGTADAVRQNMFIIKDEDPDFVFVLSGDHVYTMDYGEMYNFALRQGTEAVVGAIPVPLKDASRFGILTVDEEYRILRFDEKPKHARPIPGKPTHALASMGIYLFNTSILRWYLEEDTRKKSSHDFGRDILPQMVADRPVFAYPFEDPKSHAQHYWRDIGTLDAYWEANMDLVAVNPPFNLYDQSWPLRTYQGQFPPAKFVFADDPDTKKGRIGHALDSIVSGGCIISGSRIQNCVLSPAVHVDNYAEVRDSILMENVIVGKRAKIKRAIIDKGVTIPPGTHIGYDLKADAERFTVTESGLVAISKGMKLK